MLSDDEIAKEDVPLEKKLKYHQEKLLQVTKRNRSVQFKKAYNKHNFDLARLTEFNDDVCDKIFKKAIKAKASSTSILLDSVDDEDADAARHKLRTLSNNLRQIEEETGQQTGFVGFPFIVGHANPDFFIRGPLILFPVGLEQKRQQSRGGWYLNFGESAPMLNGALLSAIKTKAERDIPDDIYDSFDELVEDMEGYDASDAQDEFLERIAEWIKEIIPFDDALCDHELAKISDMTVRDIDGLEMQKFHIRNHMVLGNFPQADNDIYKDYNGLLDLSPEDVEGNPLGDLFGVDNTDDGAYDDIVLDDVPDQDLNLVLDSDSSQDHVILESKRSSMVVVRGPPGTGKSQVITNLVSDALVDSKKVLVVCQKRAALEVVRQRLGSVKLDRFVVLLDKELTDRKKIYAQLEEIISGTSYDPMLSSIPDPIYKKTLAQLAGISDEINQRIAKIREFTAALREPYSGVTIQQLYSKARHRYESRLNLADIGFSMEYDKLEDYLVTFSGLEKQFKRLQAEIHPWAKRTDFSSLGGHDKENIRKNIASLIDHTQNAIIVDKEKQEILLKQFETCATSKGFLGKFSKRGAEKTIKELLNLESITDEYIKEKHSAVKQGITFWEQFPQLLSLFTDERQNELYNMQKKPSVLHDTLEALRDLLEDFDDMWDYDRKIKEDQLSEKLLSACKENFQPEDDWTDLLREEIYLYWIHAIESKYPVLRGNPIDEYRINRDKLAELIKTKKELVINNVQSKILNASSHSRTGMKWKDFRKELKRKRKVKPIRRLFHEYPEEFLDVAPCWLASPESVSKVFPLQQDLFDLVIVDEASQLAVERAIPFLYRAASVVVAGDEKQMPPYDLFQLQETDDEDEEYDESSEKSLLDRLQLTHEPIQLSWHYRSRHQELIDFSNHAFYDGKLQIAPNRIIKPGHPPIRYKNCNGVWQDRQNFQEADVVLDEIHDIWKSAKPGNIPSIGIVTFNDQQRDLIQDQFEKRRERDDEFNEMYLDAIEGKDIDERPFFKNIENVQGDERDIIIFSVGYAKDSDGKFSNMFGSLNKKGGENRLNVAITRAKQQMIVICSIEPTEIKKPSKNLGPVRFRQFLEYAKAISEESQDARDEVIGKLESSTRVQDENLVFESPFETQVYEALRAKGYEVNMQIGVSGYRIDLGIVDPNDPTRYILGVECDGAQFHSAKSVKERDVMRQKFLESKGWSIMRIWSRHWWKNPTREVEKIVSKVDKLLKQMP